MKLVKGTVKEDRNRDVFWQRSYVEDGQGNTISKIIICASQESLSLVLNKTMTSVQIDDQMNKWFEEKTDFQYSKFLSSHPKGDGGVVYDIYPPIDAMIQFAESVK